MSGLFGLKQTQAAPVAAPTPTITPTPPTPMPDSQSPAALEAARQAQADIMSRAGRTSTILTAPGQRGGGQGTAPYGSSKLGAAS